MYMMYMFNVYDVYDILTYIFMHITEEIDVILMQCKILYDVLTDNLYINI